MWMYVNGLKEKIDEDEWKSHMEIMRMGLNEMVKFRLKRMARDSLHG